MKKPGLLQPKETGYGQCQALKVSDDKKYQHFGQKKRP